MGRQTPISLAILEDQVGDKMAIPTFEEYRRDNPEASWVEYVSRFSAMSAHSQIEAGEIPSDYTGYSFTDEGVWVKSGTMASIGGLPGAVKGLFPGVEKAYQEAREQAVEGSVITSSRAGEPQTSFTTFGGLGSDTGGSIPLLPPQGGETAPVQWDDVDRGESQSAYGNVTTFEPGVGPTLGNQTFISNGGEAWRVNGANGESGGGGLLAILALLALAL